MRVEALELTVDPHTGDIFMRPNQVSLSGYVTYLMSRDMALDFNLIFPVDTFFEKLYRYVKKRAPTH